MTVEREPARMVWASDVKEPETPEEIAQCDIESALRILQAHGKMRRESIVWRLVDAAIALAEADDETNIETDYSRAHGWTLRKVSANDRP